MISELEISTKAKEKTDYLSSLGLEDMKEETNSLLNSTEYTDKEKQYFAVYTSVYICCDGSICATDYGRLVSVFRVQLVPE